MRIKRDIKTYGTKLNSPRWSTSPGHCSPRCHAKNTKPLPPPPPLPSRMNDEAAATSVGRQGHDRLRQTTVSPPTISEAELASDDQRITTPLPPNER